MRDSSKVTIRLDENGRLAKVEMEGDIDRDHLTEERPEAPPLPADPNAGRAFWRL